VIKAAASDDCGVKDGTLDAAGATATTPGSSYEWTIDGASGAVHITVTATDNAGRTGSASVDVVAPKSGGGGAGGGANGGAGGQGGGQPDPGADDGAKSGGC